MGGCGEAGRSRRRGNHNQDIIYKKIKSIFNKKKKYYYYYCIATHKTNKLWLFGYGSIHL